MRQVGTDLVRSPGDRLALDEARLAVLRVSEQPHERTRRPKYPLLLVLCRLFVVQRDAFVLGQLVLFHPLGLPVVLVLGCTRLCGVCGVCGVCRLGPGPAPGLVMVLLVALRGFELLPAPFGRFQRLVGRDDVHALDADECLALAEVVVQRGVHVKRLLFDLPEHSSDVQFLCLSRRNRVQHVPCRRLVFGADEHPGHRPVQPVCRRNTRQSRPPGLDQPHDGILPVLSAAMHRHTRRLADDEVVVVLLDELHLCIWHGRLVPVHQMPYPDPFGQRRRELVRDFLPDRTLDPQPTVSKRLLVVLPAP